jgi:hypothetical protein
MSTGFAVTAFVAMFLNVMLPMEIEDNDAVDPEEPEPSREANTTHTSVDDGKDAPLADEKRSV